MTDLPPLLWLDIETTGLDPDEHQPLELALVATDKQLNIIDQFSGVFNWSNMMHLLRWSDAAKAMHEANGLLEYIRNLPPTDDEECDWPVVEEAIQWIKDGGHADKQMAGSSVQFDRNFGNTWFPELIELFHYRNFDVRTLRTWYAADKPDVPHRALDDLLIDIETVSALRRQHE